MILPNVLKEETLNPLLILKTHCKQTKEVRSPFSTIKGRIKFPKNQYFNAYPIKQAKNFHSNTTDITHNT